MTKAEIGTNVKDIMTRDVVTVKEDDTLQDLLGLFKKYHYHSYPVVTSEGELKGVVNEDIVLQCLLIGSIPSAMFGRSITMLLGEDAKGIMDPHPITISPNASLEEAATLMIKNSINRMWVVADKKLLGVLAKRDIINEIYGKRY
ncbi:MAG: CBS domain-containing protein [Methanocellales archaeon]|nr:CBS domain-containing protein [Methanocellales archaeon]MDD3291842.1 CBS domain-containing protein [Methanocellales archaeon]MDD5235485.1 CBS domain-containing protein [Methanocellales archaeon]MDD5485104.1 CBS domain-containing protein [Methanocellales archaeon]